MSDEKLELQTRKPTIITASGQYKMDTVIESFEEFETLTTVDYKEDLYEACKNLQPDILIVSDSIGGKSSLFKALIQIKTEFNNIRIIYFCGKVDFSDTVRLNGLNLLIAANIFDIITEDKIEMELIKFVLKNPRTKDNVDFLETKHVESIYGYRKSNQIEVTQSDNELVYDSSIYQNLMTFMSTKGGSGKSLIVANVAVAIASNGLNNQGNKPKVGIIDFDLGGFGITDYFKTANKEKNIIRASIESQRIIKNDGTLNDNKGLKLEVIDNIRKMFIPTQKYSNIYILGGPEREFRENDVAEFKHEDLVFIIEAVVEDYDILIVDMNSDLEYSLSYPLFTMSKNIYSVVEMNFRAFRAQLRQAEHIDNYLSNQKIKYILNKKIDEDKCGISVKELEDTIDYNFLSKIPLIPQEDIFDADFKGEFIINKNKKELLEARYELFKIANDIWPIRNFDKLAQKMEAIFDNKEKLKEEEQLSENESKLSLFIKNSIGLDKESEDLIKEGLKKSNATKELNDIGSKVMSSIKDFLNSSSSKKNKASIVQEDENSKETTDENTNNNEQEGE